MTDIKRLRTLTGMTQKAFCEYLGIPVRTVQDWEAGKRTPPDYVVEMIKEKINGKEKKMGRYYIDYGTGAGNEWVHGTLEDAKAIADEGATYTQCSITIQDSDYSDICTRHWDGSTYDKDMVDDENPIIFGDYGFYSDWDD